jgi:hypothetical protein
VSCAPPNVSVIPGFGARSMIQGCIGVSVFGIVHDLASHIQALCLSGPAMHVCFLYWSLVFGPS